MRTFVFAAVSAASLVVIAACRSETASAPVAADADASVPEEDASADASAAACPGPTPRSYPWAPPQPQADVCTDTDLDALASAIATKSLVGIDDIRSALGPACAACAVGSVSDPVWRAILDGHAGYIGNAGGCVVHLGATEACGQATDALSTCLIVGCEGCTTRKEQDTCADQLTAVDGACAASLKKLRSSCTSGAIKNAFDSNGTCQSFVETIRLFCGPRPPQDAGTD